MGSAGMAGTDPTIDVIWRQHRPYLVDLAFRMLGNIHDAEDVVQEAFARLLGADVDQIGEIRGWLVVVVSRLCLDQLRSAKARHEAATGSIDDDVPRRGQPVGADPADRVTLDDSVRMALLVVLEQLTPPERAVFVLHDVFHFSFDDVGGIVGRSAAACRQLASRARRRIESETGSARFSPGAGEQHKVAEEFIAACAGGDLEGLMRLLDPDVVGDVDLGLGGPPRRPFRGHRVISRNLLTLFGPDTGVTLVSQPVNGGPGALAFSDRVLFGMLAFTVRDGRIHEIHAIADPRKVAFVSGQMAPHS